MTRSESRKTAFSLLFQQPVNPIPVDEVIELARDESEIETDDFCISLLHAAYDNLDDVDGEIIKNLKKGWTLSRIPKASLAVLRLSCAQLMFMRDIPSGVVINEAVELAKEFGGDDEPSFVNGLLRSVYTEHRGDDN